MGNNKIVIIFYDIESLKDEKEQSKNYENQEKFFLISNKRLEKQGLFKHNIAKTIDEYIYNDYKFKYYTDYGNYNTFHWGSNNDLLTMYEELLFYVKDDDFSKKFINNRIIYLLKKMSKSEKDIDLKEWSTNPIKYRVNILVYLKGKIDDNHKDKSFSDILMEKIIEKNKTNSNKVLFFFINVKHKQYSNKQKLPNINYIFDHLLEETNFGNKDGDKAIKDIFNEIPEPEPESEPESDASEPSKSDEKVIDFILYKYNQNTGNPLYDYKDVESKLVKLYENENKYNKIYRIFSGDIKYRLNSYDQLLLLLTNVQWKDPSPSRYETEKTLSYGKLNKTFIEHLLSNEKVQNTLKYNYQKYNYLFNHDKKITLYELVNLKDNKNISIIEQYNVLQNNIGDRLESVRDDGDNRVLFLIDRNVINKQILKLTKNKSEFLEQFNSNVADYNVSDYNEYDINIKHITIKNSDDNSDDNSEVKITSEITTNLISSVGGSRKKKNSKSIKKRKNRTSVKIRKNNRNSKKGVKKTLKRNKKKVSKKKKKQAMK